MSNRPATLAAIVLAAGEGSRIGKPKALVEYEGVTFTEMIVRNLQSVNCNPVYVVGGAEADKVRYLAESLNVNFVHNSNWQSGQFSSLKAAVANSGDYHGSVLMALVDHPFVLSETYEELIDIAFKNPESIIIPVKDGKRGHPIVIPEAIIKEIANAGNDVTLRDITSEHKELIINHPVMDDGILKDIDRIADLESV